MSRRLKPDYLRTQIIRPTLKKIGLHSASAEELLLGTCAQETLMGYWRRQVNGKALGIYQVEPFTHRDLYKHFLNRKPALDAKIRSLASGITDFDDLDEELVNNLEYSTAIARLVYARRRESLPNPKDIPGLARYWKKYYNTYLGAGTTKEFIRNYNKYVKGK